MLLSQSKHLTDALFTRADDPIFKMTLSLTRNILDWLTNLVMQLVMQYVLPTAKKTVVGANIRAIPNLLVKTTDERERLTASGGGDEHMFAFEGALIHQDALGFF